MEHIPSEVFCPDDDGYDNPWFARFTMYGSCTDVMACSPEPVRAKPSAGSRMRAKVTCGSREHQRTDRGQSFFSAETVVLPRLTGTRQAVGRDSKARISWAVSSAREFVLTRLRVQAQGSQIPVHWLGRSVRAGMPTALQRLYKTYSSGRR